MNEKPLEQWALAETKMECCKRQTDEERNACPFNQSKSGSVCSCLFGYSPETWDIPNQARWSEDELNLLRCLRELGATMVSKDQYGRIGAWTGTPPDIVKYQGNIWLSDKAMSIASIRPGNDKDPLPHLGTSEPVMLDEVLEDTPEADCTLTADVAPVMSEEALEDTPEADCAPAADMAPVRRGRWIKDGFFRKCSQCGAVWHEQWVLGKALAYCPQCGAEMRQKESETNE